MAQQIPCLVAIHQNKDLVITPYVGDDGACELRAAGFSPAGRSFVIATSYTQTIVARR